MFGIYQDIPNFFGIFDIYFFVILKVKKYQKKNQNLLYNI